MERLRSKSKNRPRKTQWKCCVPLCGEKKTSDNHLHCVPQDEKRRNSWGCALGMNLKPSHRVCSDHFKEEDYIPTSGCGLRPNLKRTAIPSSVPVPVQSVNDVIDEDEMLRRREALKELEAVPSHMTVFPEDLPALKEEARNLLCCISSKECCLFVESYIEDSRNEHSSVLLDGGLGPFHLFPDMTNELYNILEMYTKNRNVSPRLKFGKLLTEVITWSIQKQRNCTWKEASDYFEERNQKIEICYNK